MTATHPRRDFLIDDYDLGAFARLAADFGQDRYGYVVTPNADHLIRWHQDADFRRCYAESSFVLLDSRFLAALFRAISGASLPVCTGSDLTERLLSGVIRPQDPLVLIGCEESQVRRLEQRYGLCNLKHFNPPMGFINDPAAVENCLEFIERNSPFRFCLLAVGTPRQEILARALRARGIARGLTLCVGASINFLTGKERRAPRWMQRLGIEWLFRLMHQPSRLAHRYLVRGPQVFWLVTRTHPIVRPAR